MTNKAKQVSKNKTEPENSSQETILDGSEEEEINEEDVILGSEDDMGQEKSENQEEQNEEDENESTKPKSGEEVYNASKQKKDEGGNTPYDTDQAGSVHANVWKNETGDGGSFYTFEFYRNYQDKAGDWHETKSMRLRDLPHLLLLSQKLSVKYATKGGENNDE